ncbi:MAG: LamG domain-containing protein [Verrucomicrobia bacterium]|nr:LamG domain-containing protein [Verrucomicrobiota bacterium]
MGAWSFAETGPGLFGSTGPSPLPARRVGSLGLASGPHGPAIRLDGTGYVEVAPQPALDFTEAGTFAAWIRPESFPAGGMRILDKSEVGTSNGFLLDTHPGRCLRLITQVGTLDHAAQLEPGRWTHVAGTVSADGRLALYMDGQPVAERAGAGAPDVAGLLRKARRLEDFHRRLAQQGLAGVYEAAHARLALESLATAHERFRRLDAGMLRLLAEPRSQVAADYAYLETAQRLVDGLVKVLDASASDGAPERAEVIRCWEATARE